MANKKVTPNKASAWDEHSKLGKAVVELNEINRTHGVDMRGGKKYTMVKDRVEIFRKHFHLDLGIETFIEYCDDTFVRMKAIITQHEKFGDTYHIRVIGSGHAEELRGSTNVNKTSALENAETGAIGRALASIGLAGGEYASANEMEAVSRKEKVQKSPPPKATPTEKAEPVKEAEALFINPVGKRPIVINPDGVETEVVAEGEARLEDLVLEAFKTFVPTCDTDEHLDAFLGMNKEPIKVLENSDRWDEFCELGKRQRVRIKQVTKGDTDE